MPVAVAAAEAPDVGQDTFLEQIERWRDRSLLTGTTRIFEVPLEFRLPCTKPGQASVEGDPCAG